MEEALNIWADMYNKVDKERFNLMLENGKLKQTLTEIKEICHNNDELSADFNVVNCDKYKLGKHNLANKIIEKIRECGGENES